MTAILAASDAAIAQAVTYLQDGQLIVFPTDTVYGLACREDLPGAIERLFSAKDRPPEKQIARLVADLDQVEAHGGRVDARARRLAERFWPGPLTLVLPHENGDSMGYRMPDHPVALQVLRALGRPLMVTSANRSGEAPAVTAEAAAAVLDERVSLILDGGPSPLKVASSVVRLNSDSLELLREGELSLQDLRDALG